MRLFSEHNVDLVTAKLWQGDAGEALDTFDSASIDLIITSPPYFMDKEYDKSCSKDDFIHEIRRVLPKMLRAVKGGGSICWQIGNHFSEGVLMPLDLIVGQEVSKYPDLVLRNRIIWTFNHGVHATRRFSGRHETILWYTKGPTYHFDLDSVRVPQIYPGKRSYKGANKGNWSGNPLGKNPGDVWEIGDVWSIPNVKANHVEKTEHPCQFPTALVRRLVTALTLPEALVVDPYAGSGSAGVAALLEGRNFIGSDLEPRYLTIAKSRLEALEKGRPQIRDDTPVLKPSGREKVATRPPHFFS